MAIPRSTGPHPRAEGKILFNVVRLCGAICSVSASAGCKGNRKCNCDRSGLVAAGRSLTETRCTEGTCRVVVIDHSATGPDQTNSYHLNTANMLPDGANAVEEVKQAAKRSTAESPVVTTTSSNGTRRDHNASPEPVLANPLSPTRVYTQLDENDNRQACLKEKGRSKTDAICADADYCSPLGRDKTCLRDIRGLSEPCMSDNLLHDEREECPQLVDIYINDTTYTKVGGHQQRVKQLPIGKCQNVDLILDICSVGPYNPQKLRIAYSEELMRNCMAFREHSPHPINMIRILQPLEATLPYQLNPSKGSELTIAMCLQLRHSTWMTGAIINEFT
eukprot:scaffold59410_cov66-Attheya_sp.AAC.6